MEELYNKIKKARELLNQTQKEFAENIGVKQKDVSLLELGGKKFIPNEYIQYLIEQNFDLNTLFNDNLELDFKKGSYIVQETIDVYGTKTDKRLELQTIPLYDINAVAGVTPIFSDLNSQTPLDFLHIPNAPKSDGAIYATGDSMYPLVKSGDILCYKHIKDILNDVFWGQMYIIDLKLNGDDLLTTKYVKKGMSKEFFLLVSANQHHQDKEVHISKIRSMAHVKTIVRFP